jgi:hypothetical protein
MGRVLPKSVSINIEATGRAKLSRRKKKQPGIDWGGAIPQGNGPFFEVACRGHPPLAAALLSEELRGRAPAEDKKTLKSGFFSTSRQSGRIIPAEVQSED